MSLVWKIPGPAAFLSSVAQGLLGGQNLVIHWPNCALPGFEESLLSEVAKRRDVRAAPANGSEPPVEFIYRALWGEVPHGLPQNPIGLARDERLWGKVLILLGSVEGP